MNEARFRDILLGNSQKIDPKLFNHYFKYLNILKQSFILNILTQTYMSILNYIFIINVVKFTSD